MEMFLKKSSLVLLKSYTAQKANGLLMNVKLQITLFM